MKKSAVLLIFILSIFSCSLFRGKAVPYPTGVIFPVEKDQEIAYEGEIVPPIQRENHLLYFSTRKGKIYCFDGQKQEMLWQVDIPSSLSSSPYLTDDRIFVNDRKATLYCLDRDGKLRWKATFVNRITSGIAVGNGQLYICTKKGLLSCLDAGTGQVLWQYQADDEVGSNLVVWRDYVLFGCDDNHIYVVDKRGQLSGKFDAGGRIGKTLAVDKDLLFFGTEDQNLHCMSLKHMKRKWKIRAGGATFVPPVVAGKRIFFLCWNCVLYCLNKKNGTILWWGSIPSMSYYRVEVIENKVVVSSFSPELVCFNIRTGENCGRFDASQEITQVPS